MLKPAILAMALLLSGCLSSMNPSGMIGAGANLYRAATLDETQAKSMAMAMRRQTDSQAQIAPANSPYSQRLDRLMSGLKSVNGIPLDYKVYMTREINANAAPDGSVRVYSSLMDTMDDNELRFVIGHEIGHVAKGHSLNAMRVAYATEAARQGAGALSPAAAAFTNSQLGALAKEFVNAQYSQSQENDADAYAMQFLKEHGYDTSAAARALRKLSNGSRRGLADAMFSSHPDSLERAARMEKLAATGSAGN